MDFHGYVTQPCLEPISAAACVPPVPVHGDRPLIPDPMETSSAVPVQPGKLCFLLFEYIYINNIIKYNIIQSNKICFF